MPIRHSRHAVIAAAATVAALLTSACEPNQGSQPVVAPPPPTATKPASNGLADKSPQAALAAVGAALRGAKSVHMKGSTVDDGDVIGLDMTLTQNSASGKMRGPIGGRPVSMQMISAGGRLYLRSPQLWQAAGGQAAAQRIGDRWVAAPEAGGPDVGFLSLGAFAKEVLKPKGRLVKGKSATIAGQPVFSLIDSGDRSVLYVAATGKPYPLRMTDAGGKRHVDFTDYDAPVTITAPPNAVDFNTVMGG